MAVTALQWPGIRVRSRARARTRPLRLPIENTLVWAGAFAFYIGIAQYVVLHLHYMIPDAVARVDNAYVILFSRDPHLAALGMQWPPLPSFLMMPIMAFKGLWPPLATQGFAGSIEAAAFSAGTVVLLNVGLRWAGVVRGLRVVLCLVWMINPMLAIYATQGMSEAVFIFFFFASILVFLRWCDSGRTSLLPLVGILAGCAALCRIEAILVAFLIAYAVIVQSIQNGSKWRQVETEALLYLLPAVFVMGLWLVSAAIIFHDPFYVLHSYGFFVTPGTSAQPTTTLANSTAYGVVQIAAWTDTIKVAVHHLLDLFPAIVVLLAMLVVQLVVRKRRVAGVMLLILGLAIPAFDLLLLRIGTSPLLRYQISVIPFAFLAAIHILRAVRGRRALISSTMALGIAVVMVLSTLITAQTLANPSLAVQESPVMRAVASGRPIAPGEYNLFAEANRIDQQVLNLDWDH